VHPGASIMSNSTPTWPPHNYLHCSLPGRQVEVGLSRREHEASIGVLDERKRSARDTSSSVAGVPAIAFAVGVLCILGGFLLIFWADLDQVQAQQAAQTAAANQAWSSQYKDRWEKSKVCSPELKQTSVASVHLSRQDACCRKAQGQFTWLQLLCSGRCSSMAPALDN
jgi:hypothetical protein